MIRREPEKRRANLPAGTFSHSMGVKAEDAASDNPDATAPQIRIEHNGRVRVILNHNWTEKSFQAVRGQLEDSLHGDASLVFEDNGLERSDAEVISGILELVRLAERKNAEIDVSALPDSVEKLIQLARATPERQRRHTPEYGWIEGVGRKTVKVLRDSCLFIEFLGQLTHAVWRLLTRRARFRRRDFWVTLQECGVDALPIVSLLAVLTGTILGFVGAVQLRKFGATIYMTDLVGLAMAREMACLMTGIIMSGRTGAAFAAQIGTMKVNQEIDALRTVGLSPVEFLVLPRTLALFLMLPLLTLFANVLGWTGGFIVSLPMGINPAEYWQQLMDSLTLNHVLFGLSKSFFFGLVVAITGCYYGLIAERNSAAVGQAATKAVVAGITWIVILDAIFAFLDEILKW